jgi:RNA 3'-terminal phosphate cyclase (ATP)
MLTIDGSRGEGGGQIFRTSLTLSLVTGTPFRIERIRAGRAKPGLMRQHLTALEAAAAVGDAEVDGAVVGGQEVVFRPKRLRPGTYRFAVGTAGSAGLVLQTILVPLVLARAPSRLTLEGGTHNPAAPPFEFLTEALLPLLRRMGADVDARLERAGFYPAGGGRMTIDVTDRGSLGALHLVRRGRTVRRRARALVSRLSRQIADRELALIRSRLGWDGEELEAVVLSEGMAGPGNVVLLSIESEQVVEVFTGFGEIGVRAEAVAERVAEEARRYLAADVPVGPHLADQLLLPMALAGGSAFRTVPLSRIDVTPVGDTAVDVIVRA